MVPGEALPRPGLRLQTFDRDPGWEQVNNRRLSFPCPVTEQSFGFDGARRQIGGLVSNSYRPAHYGRTLDPPRTLDAPRAASGTVHIVAGAAAWRNGFVDRGKGLLGGGPLIGFFDSRARDWRTPSTLAMRLEETDAPGHFAVGVEYATRDFRAYGRWLLAPGSGRGLEAGRRYRWSLRYLPTGAAGRGRIVLVVAGAGRTVLDLRPGHRAAGAAFDRFGMLNRMIEGNEATVYLDGLRIDGRPQSLRGPPPGWRGSGNRARFSDCLVDDRHAFGFSRSGGRRSGALGGAVWRTEATRPELAAHYADRVGPLSPSHRLYAAGTVRLVRASSDSAINLGFFSSRHPAPGQAIPFAFVGLNTDGPSSAGFYWRATLRAPASLTRRPRQGPRILPDGRLRRWSLLYLPTADGGARLTATLDGRSVTQLLPAAERARMPMLDRFGLRTVSRGGHAQVIFFDDLRYSAAPRSGP